MFKRRIARASQNEYTFREGDKKMKAADFIINYRNYSKHFNKKEYPKLIDRIIAELERFLAEKDPSDDLEASLISDVDAILDEVEANMNRHKFNFRKQSVFVDDHLALSLFVVPAAAKLGSPAAQKFAELLSKRFVERFPGTTFKIGDYDEIMNGFRKRIVLFKE